MMMSLNSKQAFAMAHSSLPEPKYSLHSSSSSTLTSNAPSSCSSSSRLSSTIISSSSTSGGGSSSEAMRRACLPTPPVRTLHNHCLKARFDSPLFFSFLDVFFMSAQQITQHLHFQLFNFYDLGCCMCLVLCAPSFFGRIFSFLEMF